MPLLQSPHWPLLIELYFFLAGLSAGAFIAAGAADLFGREEDQRVVKVGTYVALLALIPCPILLALDLGLPQRFWHMLWVFKPYSPMSMGSWALLGYGLLVVLAAFLTYMERRTPAAAGGVQRRALRTGIGAVGSLFAFFLAAYPGQLLATSAQPLWTDARTMGALFLAIGGATGMATVALVLSGQGAEADRSLGRLRRAYTWALILQAVALIVTLLVVAGGPPITARALRMLLAGAYAPTFWVGAVILGLVIPLVLEFRAGFLKGYAGQTRGSLVLATLLILLGGFLLKLVITSAGQA